MKVLPPRLPSWLLILILGAASDLRLVSPPVLSKDALGLCYCLASTWSRTIKAHGKRGASVLTALDALPEDLDSIPST